MRWILEQKWSDPELVVDPYAGSGSTGIACVQTGRKFIGFDVDPNYCEIANQRIQAAERGQPLKEFNPNQGTLEFK